MMDLLCTAIGAFGVGFEIARGYYFKQGYRAGRELCESQFGGWCQMLEASVWWRRDRGR